MSPGALASAIRAWSLDVLMDHLEQRYGQPFATAADVVILIENLETQLRKLRAITPGALTFCEYQVQAERTAREAPVIERLSISVNGPTSEVGELAGELQHAAEQMRPLNEASIVEECGDVLWRVSDILSALGISLEGAARQNISKLRRRHPVRFSPETSIARMEKVADASAR